MRNTTTGAPLYRSLKTVLKVFKVRCPHLSFTDDRSPKTRRSDLWTSSFTSRSPTPVGGTGLRRPRPFFPTNWPLQDCEESSGHYGLAIGTQVTRSAQMATSFQNQASRLQNDGYPKSLLRPVSEALLQRIKGKEKRRPRQPTEEDRRRTAVLP